MLHDMVPFYSYTSTYLLSHIQPPPIIIFLLHLIDICTARRYNGTCFCFFLQGVAVVIFPRRADRKEIQGLEVYDALGYTRTKDLGENTAGTRLALLDYMLSMAQRHSLKTWSLAFSCITILLPPSPLFLSY